MKQTYSKPAKTMKGKMKSNSMTSKMRAAKKSGRKK